MQTRSIRYKGKQIVYRTRGEGPLVVLLHGFGEDGTIWKGQHDCFPQHTLLIPDLPGSGRSDALEDMSMEGLAEAIKFLIEAAVHSAAGAREAGGAILIGHSMGGYITLAFAEKYKDHLLAFGLFHSSAFADSEEKIAVRRKGIRFMEEHGAAAFLQTAVPNLYAPASRENHPEWVEEHLAAVHNFSASVLVTYYKAMIDRPDRTAVLTESSLLVLFVLGQHDTAVPMQDGLKQSHLPQLSYIHILEQSGHMGMVEERDNANRILSQFVNTIEKPA